MTVTVTSALAGPATARYSNVYGALVDLGVLSGLGAQDVTGSGDPVAPILNAAEFYAPLTHSLILTRGTGNPTYSRATNAWEFDNEGKLITVPSGAARFGGARMVRNLLSYSEDFNNAYWSKTYSTISANASTDPLGGSTADKLVEAATTAGHRIACIPFTANIADKYVVTIYAKAAERYHIFIRTNIRTSDVNAAWFDLSAGTVGTVASDFTATITDIGGGWYRCSVTVVANASSTIYFGFGVSSGDNVFSYAGDITKGIYIWGAQLENVTVQADQRASEYVSVGVESAPYHGAGIDGVAYFDYYYTD